MSEAHYLADICIYISISIPISPPTKFEHNQKCFFAKNHTGSLPPAIAPVAHSFGHSTAILGGFSSLIFWFSLTGG